jgi:TonB-linked SusC/RagA family outer membrane protein
MQNMKVIKNILIIFTALVAFQTIGAQTVLTGVVKDATYKEALIGANVYVTNADNRSLNGCIVDINGEYRLKIPEQKNLTIVFSFVGFKSKSVKYTGQKTIDIILEEADKRTLSAVEVTGKKVERNAFGQTQRDLVSATQKVSMERLETAPVTNVAEALQGALANVDILTGADPGSGSSIRIRGTSSLNANAEPLIVLDGVPVPVNISSDFSFATANSEDYGQLLNISPSDIESIEVLKDAAATAQWGSKGANGVLLINTKKGAKGRLAFSFSTKSEYKREGSSIPMLNAKEYISMIQDAIWNSVNDIGQGTNEANNLLALLYDTKEIGVFPDWAYYDEYNQNTDWLKLVTQPGYSLDNNFSVSGGGDKADYRLSFGYLKETGTTIGTAYSRFSTAFNIRYKFSNKLDVAANYGFTRGVKDGNYTDSYLDDKGSNPRGQALEMMPNMSPYVIGADGKATKEYFTPYSYFLGSYADGGVFNPVAMVYESINRTKSVTSRMVFNLHYNFFRGLDYYGVVGFDARINKTNMFLPQSVTGESYVSKYVNIGSDAGSDNLYLTTENRLVFLKTWNEIHKVVASGIWQTSDQTNSKFASFTTGNSSSGIYDPIVGSNTKNYAGGSERVLSRSIGGVFNSEYSLMDKYIFNASYRFEASSSLASSSRWKGFPTFGFAWHLGEEKFVKNLKAISLAKIRVNWGQSGNSPSGTSPYVGTFSAITNGYGEMAAIQPVKVQLDNLRYEIVNQSNLGIDVGLFEDRLTFTVDIYDKLTKDMLQKDVKIPASTGFTEIKYYNSGKMSNKGWEFRADYDVVRNKKWRVSLNFNIAQNINEIQDLPDNKKDVYYTFGNKNYAYKFVEGDPLGSFYGYKYKGVYQNVEETYAHDLKGNQIFDINGKAVITKNGTQKVYPGDAKYEDVNGDGVIDQYDIVYIGNSNPLFTGGFGFNITYKNWGIVTTFHGRAGQKVINQVRMNNEYMYGKENQSVAVKRRWRQEGDDTDIPRALYNRGYNNLGSDRYVEDASFLRLKTVTLKYDLPKSVTTKLHIQKLQVYVTGYDLLTFTGYKGQDPEINISWVDKIYPVYIDKASTPKPLRMSFGLNVNL